MVIGIIGFLGYEDYSLRKERALLQSDLRSAQAELATTKQEYASTGISSPNLDELSTLLFYNQ